MGSEQQVVSLFAGTNGYLDEIPVNEVQRFEKEFLEFMSRRNADVMKTIADTKDLSDDVQKKLHAILKEFVNSFKVSIK